MENPIKNYDVYLPIKIDSQHSGEKFKLSTEVEINKTGWLAHKEHTLKIWGNPPKQIQTDLQDEIIGDFNSFIKFRLASYISLKSNGADGEALPEIIFKLHIKSDDSIIKTFEIKQKGQTHHLYTHIKLMS